MNLWREATVGGVLAMGVLGGVLVSCGTDGDVVPPAPAGETVNPDIVTFSIPGPDVRFWCDGTIGVYASEGDGYDAPYGAPSVAVVVDHPRCMPG